jgi:hypothetical protein
MWAGLPLVGATTEILTPLGFRVLARSGKLQCENNVKSVCPPPRAKMSKNSPPKDFAANRVLCAVG